MSLVTYEGIVLRGRDYGEAHRILSFYTWERGKISVMAKGVKKTKSRLAALCHPFSYGKFLFYAGKNFYTLSQGEILRSHRVLSQDLWGVAYASYFCELIELAAVEEDPNEAIFSLLLQVFLLLTEGKNLFLVARYFELRLLVFSGYRPILEAPSIGSEARAILNRFLLPEGWRLRNLRVSQAAQQELQRYLGLLLRQIIAHPPKSLAFLTQLTQEQD